MIKAPDAQDGRNQLIARAQALLQKLENGNGELEIPQPLRTLIENRLKNRGLESPIQPLILSLKLSRLSSM
jgi:hypothetical protein